MARKFLTPIDLTLNELRNALLQSLASDPGSPTTAQLWYNSTTNLLKWYNGTSVIDPLSRANHSGTQLSATISDLAATVQAYRLNQFASPTSSVSLGSQTLQNVAPGVNPTDGVNVNQLNAVLQGLDFKDPVLALVTTNVNIASPGTTLDGVTVAVNNRILLTGQTTSTQNGIWVWNGSAVALTRPTDASSGGIEHPGAIVSVGNTSVSNPDTLWILSNTSNVTVDTTAQTWVKFGSGGSTYTGTAPVSVSGTAISLLIGAGLTTLSNNLVPDFSIVYKKSVSVVPTATSGSFTVTAGTPSTVVWNHNLNNYAPDFTCRYYISPGSGNVQGALIEIDNIATDNNNLTLTFPTTPASNQYYVCAGG
jgi:hypothetical protein